MGISSLPLQPALRSSASDSRPNAQRSRPNASSDTRDTVVLHERVSRDATGGSNRRTNTWLWTEAAQEHFVHPGIVLQVVQVHVYLQHLLHRRADFFQLLLHFVE